ncbi:MAG: BON domain-containing protein [Chloroflexota bacterium]
MTRTHHEASHQQAARSSPSRASQHSPDRPEATGLSASITDENLGLMPPDARERSDNEDVSDVIGPDRDDARLRDDETNLDLEETPTSGPRPAPGVDFQAAGREAQARVIADETDLTTTPHSLGEEPGQHIEMDPSWTDQPLMSDPVAAVGSPDQNTDPVSEADETYTPPTDPVVTTTAHGAAPGDVEVLGGFSPTGGEQVRPQRSSDGQIGDEAIVDAVLAALRQDASTTDLEIDVTVLNGVVHLRGTVPGMEDADNAEAVASRVEGITEVREQLQISEI